MTIPLDRAQTTRYFPRCLDGYTVFRATAVSTSKSCANAGLHPPGDSAVATPAVVWMVMKSVVWSPSLSQSLEVEKEHVRLARQFLNVHNYGLGMTFHAVPLKCSIKELLPVLSNPTAHTSLGESAATASSLLLVPPSLGLPK